ncbi:hypothetical protein GCM10027020_07480 [Nocardioides salsibiostraticola]
MGLDRILDSEGVQVEGGGHRRELLFVGLMQTHPDERVLTGRRIAEGGVVVGLAVHGNPPTGPIQRAVDDHDRETSLAAWPQ